jgi:phosphoribosylcarboxyaminoimidazole (NCAIR) mutase
LWGVTLPGMLVATMAIGKAGAKNAALFPLQILAPTDKTLREKLAEFRSSAEKRDRKGFRFTAKFSNPD